MKIEEMLIENGFMVESRDDYESADGGLPEWDCRIKNVKGEYIGDFLKSHGFTEKIEADNRGKNWTVFFKNGIQITHRAFNEKNFAGEPLEVKTFSIC